MSIPASRIAKVNPSVIAAGANPINLNALYLTESASMPNGVVLSFPSETAVGSFFAAGSPEAAQASIYFDGYEGATQSPNAMLFAAYNAAVRAAFLQGGSMANVTLAQLQAMTGTLTLTIDGTATTSASINLSAATSFSNAATLILAGFTSPGFTVTFSAVPAAFLVTNTVTGASSTITFATGSLAEGIKLAADAGGFLSQGAVVDTPAGAMARIVALSQSFATFTTMFEPATADKYAFWQWSSAQDFAYLYIGWDTDANASVQGNTTCIGAMAKANNLNGGIALGGDPALPLSTLMLPFASFVAGMIASINFQTPNGRITAAFRQSGDISVTCANDTIAENLLANCYSFYGAYANANNNWEFMYNGQMPGQWPWVNSYVFQMFLNSQFQSALITLALNIGSIPYNPPGYGLVRNALAAPIAQGLAFGIIRTGVTLSPAQANEVNLAAGSTVSTIIQTQGYYLQILDPGAEARANRQTPIINFWYTDGEDIQQFTMGSTAIL